MSGVGQDDVSPSLDPLIDAATTDEPPPCVACAPLSLADRPTG
jgi:hypothetical protein